MGIQELRRKKNAELNQALAQRRDELRELQFKLWKGEMKNVRKARELKKTIARILTVMNQKARQKTRS